LAEKHKVKMPSYWRSLEVPLSEKLTVGVTGGIVAYTAWSGSGSGIATAPTVLLSLLALALLFAGDAIDRHEGLLRSVPRWRIMLREPLFWFAFCLLVFLSVQWVNAKHGTHGALVPLLPSSLSPRGARELLAKLLPLTAILVIVRHRLSTHRSMWALLTLASLVGAVMAVLAILQRALDAQGLFWLIPVNGKFFGSFLDTGQAATFFIMALCFSLSFCASDWQLRHVMDRPLDGRFWTALASGALAMTAVCLTGHRISIIAAWLILLFAAGQGTLGCWEAMTPGHRLNAGMLLGAVVVIAYFTTIDTTPYRVGLWRIKDQTTGPNAVLTIDAHADLCREAMRIWKRHAVFGTGGSGYDAVLSSRTPPQVLGPLVDGKSHVHCELLEYLLELGLVGLAFLVGTVGMAGRRIVAGGLWRDPFFLFGLIGLAWTLLGSLFGVPFRNTGVLCLWAVGWCGYSRLVALETRHTG